MEKHWESYSSNSHESQEVEAYVSDKEKALR